MHPAQHRRIQPRTGHFCLDTQEVLLTEIRESAKFENTSQVSGHAISRASSGPVSSLSVLFSPHLNSLPSQQVLS